METAVGTTDSVFADEDTTEGVQTTYVVGSGEADPPTCLSPALCAPGLLHLPLSYFSFFYAMETIAYLFCWGGVNGK